jgi:hypothetical protein|uniref:YtxH-like protein n=1 Tax=Myoviridae sp. ctkfK18 TaxID=2825165 RepID=A0A8S5VH69_9CAUD|nr:MAG TPA: YtxH-like protein [Myoviridae sp. ctkfK18]
MENFNKSVLEVMLESGAMIYWIAIVIGLLLIGILYMFLESKNKKAIKIRKYLQETMDEIFGE